MTTTVIAPAPYFSVETKSGATYVADRAGIITGVATGSDLVDLYKAGCEQVGIGGGATLIGRLLAADCNVTANPGQPIPMFNGAQPFRLTGITAKNASVSLTTVAGGVYTAVNKGGTAVVLAAQVYTALTGNTLALDLTIDTVPAATEFPAATGLWFQPTTGQGAAAVVDLFVYGTLGA